MQLVPINNLLNIMAYSLGIGSTFVDVNGNTRNLGGSGSDYYGNLTPFVVDQAMASSAETLDPNTYNAGEYLVGSTSISASTNGKVKRYVITTTSSGEATIRHILFTKLLYSGGWRSVSFAIKLDTPIELNASNNYTASFTLAITFE